MNLAYRWYCRLGIEDRIPDHSAFSRARHERFRESDALRRVFERVVTICIVAGLVGGEAFSIDANSIKADVDKHKRAPGDQPIDWPAPEEASHAVRAYLAALDAARRDDEGEGGDGGGPSDGSRGIAPHVPVWDKSKQTGGRFTKEDFVFDRDRNVYVCPAGAELTHSGIIDQGRILPVPSEQEQLLDLRAQVSMHDSAHPQGLPRHRRGRARSGPRARQYRSLRGLAPGTQEGRDAVRAHETHPPARPVAAARPVGAKDEVLLTATAQNLRRLAKLLCRSRLVPLLHVQRRYQVASGVGDDASTTPLCRRAE